MNDPNNPSSGVQQGRRDNGKASKDAATPEQIADAKAQVAASGLACDVGQVRYVGESTIKGAKGDIQAKSYEVTCAGKFGFVVQGPKGGSADSKAYSCPGLKASADPKKKGSIQCTLPANADLVAPAQALAQQVGATCTVSNVKWRGINKTGMEFYELACSAGQPGYVVSVPHGTDAPTAQNCLQLNGASCELTPVDQQVAWIAGIAAKGGKSCQATKARFVGASKSDNNEYYEIGCAQGAGFMVEVASNGEFKRNIECADASGLAGGCTFTDQATIQASANQSYGDRLKAAGLSCSVVKARLVGETRKHEDVVEYACSDRPAGLIVAFTPGTPDVVDCLDSRHFGVQCEFTTHQQQLDVLTKAMASSGKSCTVSDFSNQGTTDKNTQVFEVACGSAPGYIIEVTANYAAVKQANTCAEAAKTSAKTGLSCSLPGNH